MSDFSIKDIKSKDELKNLAHSSMQLAKEDKLKPCIYYYTLARYLAAVFEANSFKIPVQVWNEYRNSLDHLIRAFIAMDVSSENNQLKASKSHLLRACLDVTKLLCTHGDDWFKELKASKAYFTYALVDNGNFLKSLEDQYAKARKMMIHAKTHDIHLGNDNTKDQEIVDLYLDAYFAYKDLETMFYEKQGASVVSHISYILLFLRANWFTLLFSTAGKILGVVLIYVIGLCTPKIWVVMKAAWNAF